MTFKQWPESKAYYL